jgi:hypothetical protein
MNTPKSWTAVLLTAALLAASALPLWAHRPIFSDIVPNRYALALEIADPTVSQVYYSTLDPASPQTWLGFSATAGQSIYLSLGVPAIGRLRRFRPRLVLIGPGLEPIELPFAVPPGAGGLMLDPEAEPRFFHEEFTGTDSWILIQTTVRLPASGHYYVVAYPEQASPPGDKLWMAIGTKERFGLGDLLSFGKIRRFVRRFHELQ